GLVPVARRGRGSGRAWVGHTQWNRPVSLSAEIRGAFDLVLGWRSGHHEHHRRRAADPDRDPSEAGDRESAPATLGAGRQWDRDRSRGSTGDAARHGPVVGRVARRGTGGVESARRVGGGESPRGYRTVV